MTIAKKISDLSGDKQVDIEEALAIRDETHDNTPVYITILTAIGGWFSSLLLLGAWSVLTSGGGAFLSFALPGIIGIFAGLVIRRLSIGAFASQMGSGLLVVGQVAFGVGMADVMGRSDFVFFLVASAVALTVVFTERRTLLAPITVSVALIGFAILLMDMSGSGIRDIIFAIVCVSLGVGLLLTRTKGFRVEYIALAALLALIFYAEVSSIRSGLLEADAKIASFLQVWGGKIVVWCGAMWFLFWARDVVLKAELIGAVLLMTLFTVLLSFTGTAAFFLLLVGMALGWRPAAISGLLAVLWSLSRFYYDLSFTLLEKSIMLIFVGFFIIGLTYAVQKFVKTEVSS